MTCNYVGVDGGPCSHVCACATLNKASLTLLAMNIELVMLTASKSYIMWVFITLTIHPYDVFVCSLYKILRQLKILVEYIEFIYQNNRTCSSFSMFQVSFIDCLACTDPGARTPIGVSVFFFFFCFESEYSDQLWLKNSLVQAKQFHV